MKINKRYSLFFILIISSFSFLYAQENKKIAFPVSIVIFSGVDSIYWFEDSLSENTVLKQVSLEADFVKALNHKLTKVNKLDSNVYKPMIRFYAITINAGNLVAWNRVFKYFSKIDTRLVIWKRDDEENVRTLKLIFKRGY